MGKITIYRFTLYDIRSDELVFSKRWGTLEAIVRIGGQAVETSALEADEAAVRSDIAGLTDIGFTPSSGSIIRSVLDGTVGAEGVVS